MSVRPINRITRLPVLIRILAVLCFLSAVPIHAAWFRRDPPRPGKTTLGSPLVTLPAQVVGDYIIVTAKWDRKGPYNFLIDTGASVTLVSPSLAYRYGTPIKTLEGATSHVSVKSAEGEITELDAVSIKRLDLGDVRFDNVPALVYDCNAISVHLGIKVDGILGFPLFREVMLTLDYPHRQVRLADPKGTASLQLGVIIPFNNDQRTPIIPLKSGDQTFFALIDSGSDSTLRLNPVGLNVHFSQTPRAGAIASSISGDHRQVVARMGDSVTLGDTLLESPVVEMTDELSAIGGGILNKFTITFDQERSRVFLYKENRGSIQFPPKRSPGMSVTKAGAYWRIVGIVPESPAARAGIEEGDLITRIDQEPVEQWGPERFNALVEKADSITFAFLVGKREFEMKLGVIQLVP